MKSSSRFFLTAFVQGLMSLAMLIGLFALPRFAPSHAVAAPVVQEGSPVMQGPFVGESVVPSLSPAVRDLPVVEVAIPDSLNGKDTHPRHNPDPDRPVENITGAVDALAGPAGLNDTRTPAKFFDFEGVNNLDSVSPPDPNGDVGPNHYVQMVNSHFAIYDKSGNLLAGPSPLSALFVGMGGNCEGSNDGDPVVLYDRQADRWLLSELTSPSHVCIAISQTPDPTGAFYRYEFNVGDFPDYFKFSVWSDAYYMSANESSYTAYAFDRSRMLTGSAATFQKFTGQTNFLMPSDLDGPTPPPAGAPGYFYTFKDNSYHGGVDRLEVFALHVDWTTPANSTFTPVASLPITSYTYTVCGFFAMNCIPQGGASQRVDPVSEWPMFHFPYRNFGDHESLVGNFTVDVGSDVAGIRWFELRKTGASWVLYQEGTHSPDSNHHWMGSIAMDRGGNIALGYSVSSSSMFPSIRYTTRLTGDPLGTLGSEQTLINGDGSQTASNRWGDYSAMTVDPVDDCTFWYTQEYYKVSSGVGWTTRIGTFRIPQCYAADLSLVKTDSSGGLVEPGAPLTYTLSFSDAGPSSFAASQTSISPSLITINDNAVATPYPSTLNVAGLSGTVQKVVVTLKQINHTFPDDIDMILVGPGGQQAYLMSDAGGNFSLVNTTLTFDDDASAALPDAAAISSGTYKPSEYDSASDVFPAPAPAGPYATALSVFKGASPNGAWRLYVRDDTSPNSGNIAAGWTLTLYVDHATITDRVPAGVTINDVIAPAGWVCTHTSVMITCKASSLAAGASGDVIVKTTAPATTGYVTNVAAISTSLYDPSSANNTGSVRTLVDRSPVAGGESYTLDEDVLLTVPTPGVLANDSDPDFDPLSLTVITPPQYGVVSLQQDGSFTYQPNLDVNGPDSFVYQVSDGYMTAPATVDLTVKPVNDAPSFTPGPDVNASILSAYSAPWATNILAGPSDEISQTLAFTITNNTNPLLFSVAPSLAPDGVLSFTPAGNLLGSATLSVRLQDNGGAAGGGVDTSSEQTFVIAFACPECNPSFLPLFLKPAPIAAQASAGQPLASNDWRAWLLSGSLLSALALAWLRK